MHLVTFEMNIYGVWTGYRVRFHSVVLTHGELIGVINGQTFHYLNVRKVAVQ